MTCMIYDMDGLQTCVHLLIIIYCGAVKLWGKANARLQGISLNVLEYDEELNQVHINLFDAVVCECKEIWIGGANMSYQPTRRPGIRV